MWAVPNRTDGRRELTLVKWLWWYVMWSLPLSSPELLSECPTKLPYLIVRYVVSDCGRIVLTFQ